MSKERVTLELLQQRDWAGGLDLVKSSAGRLGRGSIYVHLMRLEDQGFVRARYLDNVDPENPDAPRRREYQITSRGRAALLRDDL